MPMSHLEFVFWTGEEEKEGKARNIYFAVYSIQGSDQIVKCNKKIFSIGSVEKGLPRGMVNLL
jgi:hypothetical protein